MREVPPGSWRHRLQGGLCQRHACSSQPSSGSVPAGYWDREPRGAKQDPMSRPVRRARWARSTRARQSNVGYRTARPGAHGACSTSTHIRRSHNRTTLSAPTRRRPHQAGAAWYAGGRPERSLIQTAARSTLNAGGASIGARGAGSESPRCLSVRLSLGTRRIQRTIVKSRRRRRIFPARPALGSYLGRS